MRSLYTALHFFLSSCDDFATIGADCGCQLFTSIYSHLTQALESTVLFPLVAHSGLQSDLKVPSQWLSHSHKLSALNTRFTLHLVSEIDENILFGINFPSGSFALLDECLETNDMQTPGFGLFGLPTSTNPSFDGGNNEHSTVFFLEQLCQQSWLCRHEGNIILWDSTQINQWLLDISEAWSETLTLMHLLALLGCSTKVTHEQYTNSFASPQHLFLSSTLGILVTHSSYNKTTSIMGQYKHLLCVIPFSLSVIIIKLLQIVHLIETFAYISLLVGDTSDDQAVYTTYMFVERSGKAICYLPAYDTGSLRSSRCLLVLSCISILPRCFNVNF